MVNAIGTSGASGGGMVRLAIALNATTARAAQDLLDALQFLALSTKLEPDCVECGAWIDPDWIVRYIEEWTTEAAMRQRVRSERFTSLLAIIESVHDPKVHFDFVTTTRGIDFVAEVRDQVPP